MTAPSWSWLHGPADNPDPRFGDSSVSAVRREGDSALPRPPWFDWLHEPHRHHGKAEESA